MKFLRNLFKKKQKGAEEPSSASPQVTSRNDEIEALISELGRRDILFGPNPALVKLKEKGSVAVPHLLRVLDSNDVPVVVDAINVLKDMDAKQAIPKLTVLSKSQWAEVHQAALIALATLDKKSADTLQFDRQLPYEQISRLWTSIIQGRQELYPTDVLHKWCVEAIDAMPGIEFPSKDKQAKAWGMLGSLMFKSMNPEWPGGSDGTKPCPEAKRCYEEALRAEPGESWWEGWVKRFS